MTGKVTTKQYRYATVFVVQATKYTHIHLQQSSDTEKPNKGKLIFEKEAYHKISMAKAYQTENGIF